MLFTINHKFNFQEQYLNVRRQVPETIELQMIEIINVELLSKSLAKHSYMKFPTQSCQLSSD